MGEAESGDSVNFFGDSGCSFDCVLFTDCGGKPVDDIFRPYAVWEMFVALISREWSASVVSRISSEPLLAEEDRFV